MNLYIVVILFLLSGLSVIQCFDTQDFHTLFSFIHNDPCILSDVFELSIPNYVYPYCNKDIFNNIHTFDELDYSSFVHIERMYDLGCPFSHNTCSDFCHIYTNCDFYDRIKYYIPKSIKIDKLGEVLLTTNTMDELTVLLHFLNSRNHAELLLDKSFNYYGFAYYHQYFNINFLQTNDILINNKYELKNTL